ncbi:MAG TPA: hypothetical protein DCS67_03325 [Clostridiales bacterium UBA8960]|nr:hypothetical protein [Clostridiales bacterium UBA8960]
MNHSTKGLIYIALAGLSWSTTGVLAHSLMGHHFLSTEVAFTRLFLGSLIFVLYFIMKDRSLFRIGKKGLTLTLIMGIFTQGIFNLAFFKSVSLIGVINATILLYLAPIFITFFSALFYKEKIQFIKKLGVSLSIIGSVLALTGGLLNFENISLLGVAFGLYAALGYSLVSIFSKFGLRDHHAFTLIFYSFLFGMVVIFPFVQIGQILTKIDTPSIFFTTLGLGIFPASLAYIFYFKGISTGIDLSKVGVMSLIELIFAILLSVALLGEMLTPLKIFGLATIVFSIYLMNHSKAK